MLENSKKILKPAASATILGILVAGAWLTFREAKKNSESNPDDIQRLLSISTRVTDDGTLINGAWLSRTPENQPFIDSCRHVSSTITFCRELGPYGRQLLTNEAQLTIEGLTEREKDLPFSSYEETKILIKDLSFFVDKMNSIQKKNGVIALPLTRMESQYLSRALDRATAPYRYTSKSELAELFSKNEVDVENISYLGLPQLEE